MSELQEDNKKSKRTLDKLGISEESQPKKKVREERTNIGETGAGNIYDEPRFKVKEEALKLNDINLYGHEVPISNTQLITQVGNKNKPQVDYNTSAIADAIEANKHLENQLLFQIKRIRKLKRDNRRQATYLSQTLVRYFYHREEKMGTPIYSNIVSDGKKWKLKRKKAWGFYIDRPWSRRFFVDPDSSSPEFNPDVVCRREFEGAIGRLDIRRFSMWSKSELDLLQDCVEIVRELQGSEAVISTKVKDVSMNTMNYIHENDQITSTICLNGIGDLDIDFVKVAELMNDKLIALSKTSKRKVKYCSRETDSHELTSLTYNPRAPIDCRNKFLCVASPCINHKPFTKAESMKILEFMHTFGGDPPWNDVASTLQETNRTPFQCFQFGQQCLKTTPFVKQSMTKTCNPSVWTQHDDELLFKYTAALGPQHVTESYHNNLMHSKFFPHISPHEINLRLRSSLVNPNYRFAMWTENEERLLALSMKVFRDDEFPLVKATALLPNRAEASVKYKWNQCLDPKYDTNEWTSKEDEGLLMTVEKHEVYDGWNAVAKEYPHRNPRLLENHWLGLAKEEDIRKRRGDAFITKYAARKALLERGKIDGNISLGGSMINRNRGNTIPTTGIICHEINYDEPLLSPGDFVVIRRMSKEASLTQDS